MSDKTTSTDTHSEPTDRPTADTRNVHWRPVTATKQSLAVTSTLVVARIADVFDAISYRWVKGSFAFIFLYFGLQKWPVVQGASPVRPPVRAFVEAVGFGGWIPLAAGTGLLLIGVYEVALGTLWVATFVEERYLGTSRLFVLVALMTVAHQFVGFLPLVVVPGVAFRQTQLWIPMLGTAPLPVALDWLSAFILKNLLFVGAFLYCFVEWAERYGPVGAIAIERQ